MNRGIPQTILFLFGLALLYTIVGSPLSSIARLSFSLHMTQMSILYFIIPPILLLGIPKPFFQWIQKTSWIKNTGRLFLSPKIGLVTFAVLFFMYHLPMMLTFLSQNEMVHNGYMGLLFILAFSMWWPIAVNYSEKQMFQSQKKQFALRSGLLLMPACLLFILSALWDGSSSSVLAQDNQSFCLPANADVAALLPSPFNTKFDQLSAGIFMMGLHKAGLMMTMKISNSKHILNDSHHLK